MPCDRFDVHAVNDEFCDALTEVESLVDGCPANRVILCGDWNNLLKETRHRLNI